MNVYNLSGWGLLLAYALASCLAAPEAIGPLGGLAIGMAYALTLWFVGGVYLSCMLHMGIAHRALDFKPWFVDALTLVNNTFGVYVDPVGWVNRHRLHHKYSDHAGDPNKLADDGFWKTLYLCLAPYTPTEDMAQDALFKTWPFRLTSSWAFALAATALNFALLWWLVGDAAFAATLWIGMRAFCLWINMVQNYWTHERRWGYRRHQDERDNAMNIGDWLPVTVTFSACLQNNHHHSPGLLRLSHDDAEYDFGFIAVKWMKALGLVQATPKGATIPKDVPLAELGF